MKARVAAESGDAHALEALLRKDPQCVHETDAQGNTPLFLAARAGHTSAVETLLSAGANVNAANHSNQTPLMWAVMSRNHKVVECLLHAGADVTAEGEGGISALGLAMSSQDAHLTSLLRRGSRDSASTQSDSDERMTHSPSTSIASLASTGSDDGGSDRGSPGLMHASGVERGRSASVPEQKAVPLFSRLMRPKTGSTSGLEASRGDVRRGSVESLTSIGGGTLRLNEQFAAMLELTEEVPPLSALTSLELSLIPLSSQTKECQATYRSLLKRKILGDFMVKKGGMRTNWKTRYFLLTGDHLHYFEPASGSKTSDVPLEPAATAVPLGSISLHSITGKVAKSDLGVVFGFQIPTATRVYHFRALSAQSIDRWLTVLNANVKRIQMMSSRFVDLVFRLSVGWANYECAVLRSGREFNTLGAILEERFDHLKRPAPPAFPRAEVNEVGAASKDVMVKLVDFTKALVRSTDPELLEVVTQFVTDPTASFFSADVRKGAADADQTQLDLPFALPITATTLARVVTDARAAQCVIVCVYNAITETSDVHIYEFDGYPRPETERKIMNQINGCAEAIRTIADGALFAVTAFVESKERKGHGCLNTYVFNTATLEQISLIPSEEFAVHLDPGWLANDLVDLAWTKKRADSTPLLVKAISPRSLTVVDLAERCVVRNLSVDAGKFLEGIAMVRFCKADASLVAIGSENSMQIWDHVRNEFVISVRQPCTSVVFSPDGKRIAAIGASKAKVKVWDVRTGKRLKKLAVGFPPSGDAPTASPFRPHVHFHPRSGQLLVVNCLGNAVLWNFSAEQSDETPTVINTEQVWAEEYAGCASEAVISSTTSMLPDAELALKKARLIEPAVFAECRGIVMNLPVRVDFAKFSPDGNLIVTHDHDTRMTSVWQARSFDLVAQYPADQPNAVYFSGNVSADGRFVVFANGATLHTRLLPQEGSHDALEQAAEEDDDTRSLVPHHIENDPMVPFYEHQVMITICENDESKLRKLIKTHHLNVNFRSALDGWTPLLLAAKLGAANLIRQLVKYGADIAFTRSVDNMTALHAAASSGNLKAVMTLVELGANPNSSWDPLIADPTAVAANGKPPATGITPLHVAAYNGFADVVDFLLSAGANIEGKDSHGRTAVMYAASDKRNFAAVQVLVRRGCDCSVRLRTGTSAMHEAAKADSQKMVLLLLKEGVSAENERNSKGATPVDVNPHLFSKRQLTGFLRSDTRTYLKYQKKLGK